VCCDESFRLGGGIRSFVGGVGVLNYPYNVVLVRSDTGWLCVILVVKVGWQALWVDGYGHCTLDSVV